MRSRTHSLQGDWGSRSERISICYCLCSGQLHCGLKKKAWLTEATGPHVKERNTHSRFKPSSYTVSETVLYDQSDCSSQVLILSYESCSSECIQDERQHSVAITSGKLFLKG